MAESHELSERLAESKESADRGNLVGQGLGG